MDAIECAMTGDVEFFKTAPEDVLLTSVDEYGDSVFSVAAFHGHLECCKEIYKRCPSLLYKQNNYGETALHWANKQPEVVKFLLFETTGDDIESGRENVPNNKLLLMKDKDQQTALHRAARFSRLHAARVMVEADNDKSLLHMVDKDGNTALHIAVENGNVEMVQLFVGSDPDYEYPANQHGKTPLLLAMEKASNPQSGMIIKLLKEYRALLLAVEKGNLEMVKSLIEADMDDMPLSMVNTVLHLAVVKGKLEVVKWLVGSHRDSLSRMVDQNQNTALHIAVKEGTLEMVQLFIKADTDNMLLGMVNSDGNTALHLAVKGKNLEHVKLLVERSPNCEYFANGEGMTPLSIAYQDSRSKNDNSEMIRKLLVEKVPSQFKIVIRDDMKWTLLHDAAHNGDTIMIMDIIRLCPDCLDLVDTKGRNFLHITVENGHAKVVKQILETKGISHSFLNQQNNEGNTPLHIAALLDNTIIATRLLYDSRVDKWTVNSKGEKVLDAITFLYDKEKAGVIGDTELGIKELKERSDFDLVVGALIATVSFTAGITVPGGFISDGPNRGMAILIKKTPFKAFVIANTFALLLSLAAVFGHFSTRLLSSKKEISFQVNVATCCTLGAIFAMVVSFITGSYAVLAISQGLAISVSVLCSCFFIYATYVMWMIARAAGLLRFQ